MTSRLVALLVLAVAAVVVVVVAPGRAAYPGVAGPIAYSRVETSSGTYESVGGIYVHGPRAGDEPRQLTKEPRDSEPSFSADGRMIVFSGNRDPSTTGYAPGTHIYVMNSDGTDVRQLTSGTTYDRDPAFSPNGKAIVFDRASASGHSPHIFSIGIDGSGLSQLTNDEGTDTEPTFTPNGKVIVFVSNRQSSGRRDRSNIFTMRPDGSRIKLLIGGPRSESEPDVSPDGRSIAFHSNRGHGPGPAIYIARMSGRHVRALPGTRSSDYPSWAPDGKHIAFIRFGSSSSELVVKRSDGRGFSKEFDSGGTEEEGYGDSVGAPGWGPRPR